MAKKKMYQRLDGLFEKKLTIGGKRTVFRGKTEREVIHKIAAYEEKNERGAMFVDVSASWWEQHEPQLKYGSVHVYKAAKARADERYWDASVKDIDAAEIHAFLLTLAKKGYAHKTVKNQLTVLRQIFLFALMHRQIKTLPTDGVSVPSGLTHTTRNVLPPNAAKIIKNTQPDEFLLPILILYTGARCGEALALQWQDIDFKENTISISKAIVHHSNRPVVSETKTKNANRIVPLLAPLKKILDAQPSHIAAQYIIGGDAPLTKSAFCKQWERYCRNNHLAHKDEARTQKSGRTVWACDIDRHTLRHEYATILYDAGIDAKVAQELLGHADLSTTLNIYTHIRQSKLSEAATTLNAFFAAQGTVKAQ